MFRNENRPLFKNVSLCLCVSVVQMLRKFNHRDTETQRTGLINCDGHLAPQVAWDFGR